MSYDEPKKVDTMNDLRASCFFVPIFPWRRPPFTFLCNQFHFLSQITLFCLGTFFFSGLFMEEEDIRDGRHRMETRFLYQWMLLVVSSFFLFWLFGGGGVKLGSYGIIGSL